MTRTVWSNNTLFLILIIVKYVAYNNDTLYIANKNTIHLIACKHDVQGKKIEKR